MQEEEGINTTYSLEKILQQEIIEGKPHYLVKWQGFPATESTWQPIQNLLETIDNVYKWKQQQRPKMRRHNIRRHQQSDYERNRKGYKDNIQSFQQEIEACHENQEIRKQLPKLETDSSPIYDWKEKIKKKLKKNHQNISEEPNYQNRRPIKDKFTKIQSQKMEGFRAVGRISKSQIKQVLDCFNWQSKELCEIQLTSQRKVYMLKTDVERIYPEKLREHFQLTINKSQLQS